MHAANSEPLLTSCPSASLLTTSLLRAQALCPWREGGRSTGHGQAADSQRRKRRRGRGGRKPRRSRMRASRRGGKSDTRLEEGRATQGERERERGREREREKERGGRDSEGRRDQASSTCGWGRGGRGCKHQWTGSEKQRLPPSVLTSAGCGPATAAASSTASSCCAALSRADFRGTVHVLAGKPRNLAPPLTRSASPRPSLYRAL